MLAVQYVACLRPSELGSLTTGQVIRPLRGSGTRSWALLLAPQEDLEASKAAEFDGSVLLAGKHSVATEAGHWQGARRARRRRHTSGADHSQSTHRILQNGRDVWSKRDHDGGASTDALENVRSLMEIQNEAGGAAKRALGNYERTCSAAERDLKAVRGYVGLWIAGGRAHVTVPRRLPLPPPASRALARDRSKRGTALART